MGGEAQNRLTYHEAHFWSLKEGNYKVDAVKWHLESGPKAFRRFSINLIWLGAA